MILKQEAETQKLTIAKLERENKDAEKLHEVEIKTFERKIERMRESVKYADEDRRKAEKDKLDSKKKCPELEAKISVLEQKLAESNRRSMTRKELLTKASAEETTVAELKKDKTILEAVKNHQE